MNRGNLTAFVSSKMKELHDERVVLRDTLRTRCVESFLFEFDAGARPEAAQKAYLDEVARADLYIGIFWNEFSQPVFEEFDHARSLKKPCLIYVKNFNIKRDLRLARYLDLISDAESGLTVRFFDNVVDLANYAGQDIQDWLVRDWRQKAEALEIPKFRRHRLEADSRQVQELVDRSPEIELLESNGFPPTQYLVQFQTRGILRLNEQRQPVFGDRHIVEVAIHRDYPMTLPFLQFQTPIFHPNIYERVTYVWDGLACRIGYQTYWYEWSV